MRDDAPLPAFAGTGIELEYIVVDARTLDVRPDAPALLAAIAGRPACDVDVGRMGWSNELVEHVVEIKNRSPSSHLAPLAGAFQREIARANLLLGRNGARLMPTGMHPWMDPARETRLWSHGDDRIYRAFDRLFDCRRHGWANLQSMHVNLPFAGDAQFARLHAAIRCVLPLVPALAASSPFADGRGQQALDHRLHVYAGNAKRVQAITGDVIPEPVASEADYGERILQPMYAAIAPLDPERTLQYEWLNARGAIARFDRSAIEIRLADVQECPAADMAIAAAIVGSVRALYEERWSSFAAQRDQDTQALARVLRACIVDADRAAVADAGFLALYGLGGPSCTARDVWSHVLDQLVRDDAHAWCAHAWRTLVVQGPLARRILQATGRSPSHGRLHAVYAALCDCLASGRLFDPG